MNRAVLLLAVVVGAALVSLASAQHHEEHEYEHESEHDGGEHEMAGHEGEREWTTHDIHGNPIVHHEPVHHEQAQQHHEWSTVEHHEPVHDAAPPQQKWTTAARPPRTAAQPPSHTTMPVHNPVPASFVENHATAASAVPHTAGQAHTAARGVEHDPLPHTVADHSVDWRANDQTRGSRVTVIKRFIDSPLEDIQWASDETVFVLTEQGQVWRSKNSGRDFLSVMTKLDGVDHLNAGASVKSIYISQVDSHYIFLLGSRGVHWRSSDQGESFHSCDTTHDIRDVRLHPTQKEWMLAASMSKGCSDAGSTEHCYKELLYTHDFCAHWTPVTRYVVQFDWSPPMGAPDGDGRRASDDLIFASVHHSPVGTQRFGFWQADINFVQSYNYFRTEPTLLVLHGNRFLFGEHSYLFVAAVNPSPLHEGQVNLMVSRDNTTHQLFQPAILPVELTQHSYTILDTSEGSVFLHVNHQQFSENAPTGHVYISDWSGLIYSLSLPFNHRSADGKCDFEKVEGLEGIYLANFIDDELPIDVEESEEASGVGGHTSSGSDKASHHARHRLKAKTVITFDKGGLWSYLEPPTHDAHGNPIQCAGTCHLHLHGVTDTFGPFYSTASATGLIMATGTIGTHLQSDSEINTYLSRDAGLTWQEVRKGSHIYEFGDHGGLLVMADDNKLSNSIVYSWDSGQTWNEVVIAEEPFQIENIIIEPTATSQVFIVYGWHEGKGVLVHLNFADLHKRECVGREQPGREESDYEHWTPHAQAPSKCLMGHTVKYTRRKAFAECFNPDAFERVSEYTHCACTVEDFECDFGYERKEQLLESGDKDLHAPCVPMAHPPAHQDPTAGKECVHQQRITKGYRRVPGDTCTGGDDHYDATYLPCPSFLTSGSFGRFFLILFLLIASGLCIAAVHTKYNVCNPCLVQLRRWGLGAQRGPSYVPVGADGAAHGPDGPDDPSSYLNDEEIGHSAELHADGVPKKKSTKMTSVAGGGAASGASGGSASASHSHGANPDAGLLDAAVIDDGKASDIKPLPPAKAVESVPALAPPKADDHSDFNPRSKSN